MANRGPLRPARTLSHNPWVVGSSPTRPTSRATELHDAHGLGVVFESVLTEVSHVAARDQRARHTGQEHLPSVPRRADPRGLVKGHAVVPAPASRASPSVSNTNPPCSRTDESTMERSVSINAP